MADKYGEMKKKILLKRALDDMGTINKIPNVPSTLVERQERSYSPENTMDHNENRSLNFNGSSEKLLRGK